MFITALFVIAKFRNKLNICTIIIKYGEHALFTNAACKNFKHGKVFMDVKY